MSYCKLEAPYPEPADGQKRIVFALDPVENHEEEKRNYGLVLIPGRVMTLTKSEAANIAPLQGHIKANTVDGWGYPYYEVTLAEHPSATRTQLTDDKSHDKVQKFVPMQSPPLDRYNSRAPVVVYLPEDAELRYAIWTAGDEHIATAG